MAALVDSDDIEERAILKSKIVAYESELQSITADKVLLEQDLEETREALEKIEKELQSNVGTVSKLESSNKELQEQLKQYLNMQDTYKTQQEKQNELENLVTNLQQENTKYCQDFKQFQTDSAKDVGRLKNIHQEKTENLMKKHAEIEHNLQNQIIELKGERTMMINDHKDVVTSQATRLRAYEHQINILETRNNRLQMSLEFSIKPKTQEIDREGKIQRLEQEREQHLKDMKLLSDKMAMSRLNQHYDFRSKGGLF